MLQKRRTVTNNMRVLERAATILRHRVRQEISVVREIFCESFSCFWMIVKQACRRSLLHIYSGKENKESTKDIVPTMSACLSRYNTTNCGTCDILKLNIGYYFCRIAFRERVRRFTRERNLRDVKDEKISQPGPASLLAMYWRRRIDCHRSRYCSSLLKRSKDKKESNK